MGDLASSVGEGLFAGAVGTAAMTVSSALEEVGIDAFHNLVYAGATGVAYALLDR